MSRVEQLNQLVGEGPYRVGGLDKRKLLGFLAAKGHQNLVLRVVDVLELSNDAQDLLIDLAAQNEFRLTSNPTALTSVHELRVNRRAGWRKRWLLKRTHDGWLVLPFEATLGPMSFERLEKLQAVLMAYTRIRLEKGEPNRIEACALCRGTGRRAGKKLCTECAGEGQIITFIEMSPEEKALAEQVTGSATRG